MKKIILMLCLIVVFIFSGCKDITDSFKPGSFGQTTQEKAMVEAITEKYGDLTQSGAPRLLEAMMTSNVENFIPVDIVSKYSKNADKFYAWFVYDNFDEDELEIEWTYLTTNYSIYTFKSITGEDFGRGSFILEKPDDGWAVGQYRVSIRGRGIEKTIDFEVYDGATVSVPLTIDNGIVNLPSTASTPAAVNPNTTAATNTSSIQPGWYFTNWEYIICESDESLVGAIQSHTSAGDQLLDYNNGNGDKNDFYISHSRTFGNGNPVASGAVSITWTDPQEFAAEGQKFSFELDRQYEDSWGITQMSATWDMENINPGYGTSGKINFVTPDGNGYLSNDYQGTFTMQKAVSKGSPGKRMAIIINLANGYGYKYYYEWKE